MKISAGNLELDASHFVTSTQAILAKKGSGKSYTGSVQAEELLAAGYQVVVIDPTGAWWGLRASSDGQRAGYPIAVFGGEHGDIPLEQAAGEIVADAIATEHFSAILDLTLFRKGDALRFCTAFMETLYRRNRTALHLFIDEADVLAPQRTFGPQEAQALGATEDIVRRGRIRGIGCTLISQRAQVLNKNVLSQVDMLTALRMNHPKDLDAIDAWVAVHGDVEQAKRMMKSLPSLPIGDAWMWAPATDLFGRITIRKRSTFDSGATPKAGQRVAAPKVLAEVDIQRLGATIAASAEQAKANDPKALRARIAELEREIDLLKLAKRPATERIEIQVLSEAQVERLRGAVTGFQSTADALTDQLGVNFDKLATALDVVGVVARDLTAAIEVGRARGEVVIHREDPMEAFGDGKPHARREPKAGAAKLSGGERKILTALAQYAPKPRTKTQIAILTGYAHNGGGFNNLLSSLRTKQYASGMDPIHITEQGLRALGDFQPLPRGRELLEHWSRQLGKAERILLKVLFEQWPKALTKATVASLARYAVDGGGFNNALSRLRTLELISGRDELRCCDEIGHA